MPIRTARSLFAFVLALAPLLSGCTALGFGIGSAVPAYETQRAGEVDPGAVSTGDHVRIVATPRHGEGRREIAGRYRGFEDDALLIDTWAGEHPVRVDEIEVLRIRRGNYAAQGAFIGLAVDLLVVCAYAELRATRQIPQR